MSSNISANPNQNSKPVPNVRPKSSMLPPLVPRSSDKDFRRRSSSFDYSFSELKMDFQSNRNKSSNGLKTNETLITQNKDLSEITPVLPNSRIEEVQRLENENKVLKNNFLRMSRIIQKHSRLMAKKDDIILKLQEKSSTHYLPVIEHKSRIEHDNFSPLNIIQQTSKEIETKNLDFSLKFRQIFESMIGDFNQHLTQFMKVIDEMQKFLENNLKVIERRNSDNLENKSDFEGKLRSMNADYSELRTNYEMLMRQKTDFKSFIQFMINSSSNSQSIKDLTSNESMASLRQYFTEILSKNQSLSVEIKSLQKSRKTEEDYCFELIESLSELELELELLGRSPQTLNKVIEKLDQKLESIRQTLSQTYLESLNKTLLQIYKNHLKWFQYVNKPSKSTQTWIQNRTEDSSTEEEEITLDRRQPNIYQRTDSKENMNENNEISEEIKSKFDELSDEMSFDDFDIESINYILMAKYFDYNLKSNLEVVEEVEEENVEEEEESDISDNVFEECSEEFNEKCLIVSENSETENYIKNEFNIECIETVVEQVLNEILDKINDQFLENMSSVDSNRNIDSNEKDMLSSPSTSRCSRPNFENEKDVEESIPVEIKPHNIDSDFVSDDLSSSPETVMTCPDNLNKSNKKNGHATLQFLTTFDELKQLNTRQSSEVVLAKTRIQELETIISEDKNPDNSQKHPSKENQYLSDELKAWKELVEQQNAIMEKIRNELELQQKLNNEKDKTIETLKGQSQSESLLQVFENHSPVPHNSDVSDDECKTLTDELELNNLFGDISESDDNEIEVIDVNHCVNQTNNYIKSDDKKSPDILIQEVWTKSDDIMENNYESSGCSVYTGNSSPLSVPEELLSTNRRKVFIPFSHEDAAVRRHSCQGRLILYGNHPMKKKLELKNVEIVFPQQKAGKELKRAKPISKI